MEKMNYEVANLSRRRRKIQKLIFVSEQENQLIKQRMREHQLVNFSNYARHMLLTGEVKVVDFDEIRELRVALNRLGTNLNQIAKKVNEDDQVTYEETRVALKLMQDIKHTVQVFLSEQIEKETGGLG